jgi:hypothetical protein
MPMAAPNTVTRTASGIEALVCADIARRQQLGIHKYGRTVADNPLALGAWLRHAYEEALDLAIYLRRAMHEQAATPTPGSDPLLTAEQPMPVLELLEWWDANTSKPDSDTTVLLWTSDGIGNDWRTGGWDGEAWIDADSGELIEVEVLLYSLPGGPAC